MAIAPQFNITIPPSLEDTLDKYLQEMGEANGALLEATELFNTYSAYFIFALAGAFGLIICACVFATMIAIESKCGGGSWRLGRPELE